MPQTITPRRTRHENSKQNILNTALGMLNTQGIGRFSVRELARRTGYSPASLYEYYGGKDDILSELRREGIERLNAYLSHVSTGLPAVERLIEIGMAYLQFARQNPEHYQLIFVTLSSKRTALTMPIAKGSPYAIVLQAVQAGIADKSLVLPRKYNAEALTYSLWAMLHGMAMLQITHLKSFRTDLDPIHKQTMEIFLESFSAI